MLERITKNKIQRKLSRCFNALRVNVQKKVQTLYLQMSQNTSFGERAAQKMLVKKCFMEWKVFRMDQKLRRSQKEIQYYRHKYEEMDVALAQSRNLISQLTEQNSKLQAQLNEKNVRLETRNKELAKVKVTGTSQKPHQVRKLLKLYFKYLFSNPLITRVRLQQDQHTELQMSTTSQQAKPMLPYNLRLLLKKRELLHEGGPGVSLLLSISLSNIMIRWVSHMIERATLKVNKLIELLEREVQIRRYVKREQRKRNANNNIDIIDDEQSSSSENEDSSNESDPINKTKQDDQSAHNNNAKQKPNTPTLFNLVGGSSLQNQAPKLSLHQSKANQAQVKLYIPFKSYKRDLKLLLTFKTMISKVLTDLDINMIDDAVLMAVAFAIDQSERKIKLSNVEYVKKVIAMAGTQQLIQQASDGNRVDNEGKEGGGEMMMARAIMPYQMVQSEEGTREEVTVAEYRGVLMYVQDTDQMKRAQLVMYEIERISRGKIDWYIQPGELLSRQDFIYTSILSYLFYWNSCLERPFQQSQLILQREATRLKLEEIEAENLANGQIFKKLLYTIQQKIKPLLQRRVNSNIQDMSLLFTEAELSPPQNTSNPPQQTNSLELISHLPFMPTPSLMLRWANHLQRSFLIIQTQHYLEEKFREKFTLLKSNEATVATLSSPKKDKTPLSANQKAKTPRDTSNSQLTAAKPQTGAKKTTGQQSNKKVNYAEEDPKEICNIATDLSKYEYRKFIMILAYLSPETLWDMHDLDLLEVSRVPTFIEAIDNFLENSSLDTKCLFILNSISRITKKNHLVSMSQLYHREKLDYEQIMIELFLQRPYLTNLREDSALLENLTIIEQFYNDTRIYLTNFNKETFEILQIHIDKMKTQREGLTLAFAFVQDQERTYLSVRERLLHHILAAPSPHLVTFMSLNLHQRFLNQEKSLKSELLWLNKDWLSELVPLRQPFLSIQWAAKLEQTIRKYLNPLMKYLTVLLDRDSDDSCYMSYFEVWRALKSLNIRSFNLNAREVEFLIIQLCKIKERGTQSITAKLSNDGGPQLETQFDFFQDDIEQEQDKFKRQLKNELEQEARQSNGGKVRVKNSIVNKYRGTSLENLGLKKPQYKVRFSPSDFMLILISIVFKVQPSDFMKEIIILNPNLKDDGLRNVNKLLAKEKIQTHVEQYVADYLPGLVFEQFLIQNLFLKTSLVKNHPYSMLMLKPDFKHFLKNYLEPLYAIFDFYQTEYQLAYPQTNTFRFFTLQLEVAYIMLQDFDALGQDSGLNKHTFRKILTTLQKAVTDEQHAQSMLAYEQVYYSFFGTTQNAAKQALRNKSTPPPQQVPTISGLVNAQNTKMEGLNSLCFFEFIEFLYLCAQYHNPDPFLNMNQKFADFIEKTVIVHIQFKLKSIKSNSEQQQSSALNTVHREGLMKAIQQMKIMRGVQMEGLFTGMQDIQ